MSIRIERAANGYIVHRMGGILTSDDLKRPMVFDSFERLVDWLAEHFREGPVSVTRPRPPLGGYPRSFEDPFGFGPNAVKVRQD